MALVNTRPAPAASEVSDAKFGVVRTYSRLAKQWARKPSGNVLQSTLQMTSKLWAGKRLLVLMAIADKMRFDEDGWTRRMPIDSRSRESLAQLAGCSGRTVQRAIAQGMARDMVEIDEQAGGWHRFRIKAATAFAIGLEVVTSSRAQLEATRLEWQGHNRAPTDAWSEQDREVLDRARSSSGNAPAADSPVGACSGHDVYSDGPWAGMSPADRDALVERMARRVTRCEPTLSDRLEVLRCWRGLDKAPAEFGAEQELIQVAVEDNCQSYAFRFLRGEIPMDDGRPSIDHSHETRFAFQTRFWKTRVAEARAHCNEQCGCFNLERRHAPAKADKKIRAVHRERPTAKPPQDIKALSFGWGAPEGDVLANPYLAWSGCLSRLRAIHGTAAMVVLDPAEAVLTLDAFQVVYRGVEGIWQRHAAAKALGDEVADQLGCRVDFVIDTGPGDKK